MRGGVTLPEESVSDAPETPQETTAPETDGLPDKNLDGFELSFYNYNKQWFVWAENQICVEETSDVFSDAIYRRNQKIEDRFNAKISETTVNSTHDRLKKLVMSDDNIFDVAMIYDMQTAKLYSDGLLRSWNDVPYISFDKEWWNPAANDVFLLNGNQFAAVGDFSMSMRSRNYLYIMNKSIYSEQGDPSEVYDLVYDGKWTLEKSLDIAKNYMMDLNGDTVMDKEDRYGITSATKLYFGALYASAGCRYIELDDNGVPYFAPSKDTRCVEVFTKLFDLSDNDIYKNFAGDVSTTDFDFFMNRHSLFLATSIVFTARFREFKDDIAFLPVPKYEESQTEYRSLSAGGAVATLPITVKDERLENIGLLLEAMSYESNKSVLPAYYESTLKSKYTRDDESVDMLEIILNSAYYDLGVSIWTSATQDIIMNDVFLKRKNTIASTIAKMDKKVNETVKALYESSEG